MTTRHESFDDALDAAIDAVARGEPLEAVLSEHAAHAQQLRPLLELAARAHAGAGSAVPPPSPRLAANFGIVRGAIRQRRSVSRQAGPWWQRRLVFASLSLPASAAIALVIAGTTGAAAAAVVVTGAQLPARVSHALRDTWVGELLPETAAVPPPVPAPSSASGPAPASRPSAVAAASPSQATVTLAGVIKNATRDGFELRTAGASWRVLVSQATRVDGPLRDGAAVIVVGVQTQRDLIRAEAVAADTSATPAVRAGDPSATPRSGTPTAPPGVGDTSPTPADLAPGPPAGLTPGPPADRTPGPPADLTPGPPADRTPGPPADRTPGPPADRTPGPPADHTPPGRSNGNGLKPGKKP